MAKQPKPPNQGKEAVAALNAALAFAKVAIRDTGEPYQTHVILWDGMLFSYDGVIATGHPVAEQIRACPQGNALRAALTRCREAVALAVTEGALSLRSGRFAVNIPCLDFGAVRPFTPDPVGMPIDDTIKTGFAILSPLIKEGALTVLEAGLRLAPAVMGASNRQAVVEFWHAFPIPREAILPKAAVQAVLASPYKLAGYGCTEHSATFWFENKSWIKTQLFAEAYPSFDKVLDRKSSPVPLAEGFLDGIKAVMPFGNEAYHIHYGPDGLRSGDAATGALGASYKIEGLNEPVKTGGYQWQLIGQHIKNVDWHTQPNAVMFFGDRIRGAISKIGGGEE